MAPTTPQKPSSASSRHLFAVPGNPHHLADRVQLLARRQDACDAVVAEQAVAVRSITGPLPSAAVPQWQRAMAGQIAQLEASCRQQEVRIERLERSSRWAFALTGAALAALTVAAAIAKALP